MHRLFNGRGPECDLFRAFAKDGHYGDHDPARTRQGTYIATPSGILLGAVNTNRAERIAELLKSSLEKWNAMTDEERGLDAVVEDNSVLERRIERFYPENGLVLRVTSRDLPQHPEEDERRRRARWSDETRNHDYAWFRRNEARALLPERLEVGATHAAPAELVHRLARLHFVDNVRGQTPAYREEHVAHAELTSTVTDVQDNIVTVTFEGTTRTVAPARERPADAPPATRAEELERGIETRIVGTASFDRADNHFTRFDLVAIGSRWGGTRFNARERDPGPDGIGFSLTIPSHSIPIAPAFIWNYGW